MNPTAFFIAFFLAITTVTGFAAQAGPPEEIDARNACLSGCDGSEPGEEWDTCRAACPELGPAARRLERRRRLADEYQRCVMDCPAGLQECLPSCQSGHREGYRIAASERSPGRPDHCPGKTLSGMDQQRVATRLLHYQWDSLIERIETLSADDEFAEGLNGRQVERLRGFLAPHIARYRSRYEAAATPRRPEGTAAYYYELRRADGRLHRKLGEAVEGLGLGTGHPLRQSLREVWSEYRPATYSLARTAECFPQDQLVSAHRARRRRAAERPAEAAQTDGNRPRRESGDRGTRGGAGRE